MRVLIILLVCGLAGLGVVGGWMVLGPGLAPHISGESGQAAAPRVKDKRRYAPYVVLVPSSTLPEQSMQQTQDTAAGGSADAIKPQSPTLVPVEKSAPGSPDVSSADEQIKLTKKQPEGRRSAEVSIAQQTLEAVQAPDTSREPGRAPKPDQAETPKPVPARQAATQPEPAPRASIAADKPAANQEAAPTQPSVQTKKRGETKLKYESETTRQSKERAEQAELALGQDLRFRDVIPVSSGKLKADDHLIVLAGIDALGAGATCRYETGRSWDCGRWGTFALRRLIRARSVVCDLIGKTSPNEAIGKCTVGRTEISRWVVRRGWGRPTTETESEYAADMEKAKEDKIGQWSQDPKPSP